jgi:hypothetical protein
MSVSGRSIVYRTVYEAARLTETVEDVLGRYLRLRGLSKVRCQDEGGEDEGEILSVRGATLAPSW